MLNVWLSGERQEARVSVWTLWMARTRSSAPACNRRPAGAGPGSSCAERCPTFANLALGSTQDGHGATAHAEQLDHQHDAHEAAQREKLPSLPSLLSHGDHVMALRGHVSDSQLSEPKTLEN